MPVYLLFRVDDIILSFVSAPDIVYFYPMVGHNPHFFIFGTAFEEIICEIPRFPRFQSPLLPPLESDEIYLWLPLLQKTPCMRLILSNLKGFLTRISLLATVTRRFINLGGRLIHIIPFWPGVFASNGGPGPFLFFQKVT